MARDQVVRRKSTSPGPNQARKLFNEIAGLILFGLGIVFLLALISYDSGDPSWNATGPQTKAHNWIGPVGALLGDALYQSLGYAALIVPFALFALAWWRLIDPRPSFSGLKLLGFGLLGFSLTGLLALAEGCAQGGSFQLPFHSGGWMGQIVVCDTDFGLARFLNTPGSAIVLMVILGCGLILATPFSLVALIMRLTPREQQAGVIRTLSERFRSWRQIREIERERHAKAQEAEKTEARQRAAASSRLSASTPSSVNTAKPAEAAENDATEEKQVEVKVVRRGGVTLLGLSDLFTEKPETKTPPPAEKASTGPTPLQIEEAVALDRQREVAPSSAESDLEFRATGPLEGTRDEHQTSAPSIKKPFRTRMFDEATEGKLRERTRNGSRSESNPDAAAAPAMEAEAGDSAGSETATAAATEATSGAPQLARALTGRIASRLLERFKARAARDAEAEQGAPNGTTTEGSDSHKLRTTAPLEGRVPEPSERRRVVSDRIVGVPVHRSIPEPKQRVESRSTSFVKHLLRQEHKRPTTDMLTAADSRPELADHELRERARQLTEKCQEFSVAGIVTQISPGPVVTTFEFKLDPGVKYGRVTSLVDDLCLGLKAESIRIDRIPGKSTVGIEIPNRKREIIRLREVLESQKFSDSQGRLTLALGKTIDGSNYVADLAKMPHLLIAGATGAGKSVALNTILISLLFKSSPDDVKLILIDPKRLELGLYADIPHLLTPIVTDPKRASFALKWAVTEMENRYKHLAAFGVRNIDQYNHEVCASAEVDDESDDAPKRLPYLVIVIDELADLMMVSARDVEESITRLAQMARAVGIHLVLATQRPSTDVITGLIKANFPSRISFRVSSKVDSRVIIDTNGAEGLLGQGDMLFLPPGTSRLIRVHGAYVDEKEVKRLADFIRAQRKPEYDEKIQMSDKEIEGEELTELRKDEKYEEALRIVFEMGRASTSVLQRRLRIGYGRAASIIDAMHHDGVVGPEDGSKPRQVLIPPDERRAFVERLDQMREDRL